MIPRKSAQFAVAVVATVSVVALAGCGGTSSATSKSKSSRPGKTELVVFAASSLTETFTTMAANFEKAHPGVKVVTDFDSSSTLVQQIQNGAKADVMATADTQTMQPLVQQNQVAGKPAVFATNHLIVVAPKSNPGHVTGIASLSKVDFVVCDPSAPCGIASQQALKSAGISAKPKSLEENVKAVLTKITTDAADAGIVYVTDAKAAGSQVTSFPIPARDNVETSDLIAVVKASKEQPLARQWIAYVTSAAGQKILHAASFGPR